MSSSFVLSRDDSAELNADRTIRRIVAEMTSRIIPFGGPVQVIALLLYPTLLNPASFDMVR